jgi:hypothetical protein
MPLSSFDSYDHEFVCLSNGLDPAVVSAEEATALNKLDCASAGEMIKQRMQSLPNILIPHVDLLASTFDWKAYKKRNQDLRGFSPVQLVAHFLDHGMAETRHWSESASLMDRRFAWATYSISDCHLRSNVQAVVHVYHYNVLCGLLPYLKTLARLGAKIYLLVVNQSISSSALDEILDLLFSGAVKHQWLRLPNHGEDWSSFHAAYDLGLFEPEGVTYKIQTKLSRNLGSDGGSSWIDEALGPICGNQAAVSKALSQLLDGTHAVASSSAVSRKGFGENPRLVRSFAGRVCDTQTELLSNVEFAAGSMFAARNSFIREFYSAIGSVDYSKEYSGGSAYCGRYAGHALERVFFYFAMSRSLGRGSLSWLV